jgi:hypothetical protein
VALTEPVDLSHALNPTNDSERLVFRQMLETLVRVDCMGNLQPGLARSWQKDGDGKGWTFTLREGASWAGTFVVPEARAFGIDSATTLGDRRVHVRVQNGGDTLPRLFAEPALVVFTGLASDSGAVRRFVVPGRDGQPSMDFQLVENGDPRDAIDHGIDLAVTRDPSIVEYVAGRPDLKTYPLPWSRTYLLLQPSGAPVLPTVTDSVRSSLAQDAVRAEARPAEPPFWWDSLSACRGGGDSLEQHLIAFRIVYPRGDEVARGLAERLVALAGSGSSLRAAALEPAEFTAAVRDRTERGYVVPAPRTSLAPCRDASAWPVGTSIQPLVETRATAIVRRGSPPLTVDWDGTVRVLP